MLEILTAVGLLLFIEGLLYALFPSGMKSMLNSMKDLSEKKLRVGGLIFAIILADARKTAQITRGEGDGLRNKIFADAFGRDPEFFSFYRAMQSYEKSLISGSETSLVLSPDSEFFRYFGESGLHKILKK